MIFLRPNELQQDENIFHYIFIQRQERTQANRTTVIGTLHHLNRPGFQGGPLG